MQEKTVKYGVMLGKVMLGMLRLLCTEGETVGQLVRRILWDYINDNMPPYDKETMADGDLDACRRADGENTSDSLEVYLT